MGAIFIAQSKNDEGVLPWVGANGNKPSAQMGSSRHKHSFGRNSCKTAEGGFTIETFQEADPILSERGQRIIHLHLADNFQNLFTLAINILHLWCRVTHIDH